MKLTIKSIFAILGLPFFLLGILLSFIWINLSVGFFGMQDMYVKLFKGN